MPAANELRDPDGCRSVTTNCAADGLATASTATPESAAPSLTRSQSFAESLIMASSSTVALTPLAQVPGPMLCWNSPGDSRENAGFRRRESLDCNRGWPTPPKKATSPGAVTSGSVVFLFPTLPRFPQGQSCMTASAD